jgi:hypothetical protein
MKTNKVLGATLLLLGILFIIGGGASIYAMILVGNIFSNPMLASVVPGMTGVFAFGWIMGVLMFVTGILSIVSSITLLREKTK